MIHCEQRAISSVLRRQIFITIKNCHPSATLGVGVKDREELSGQLAACAVEKPKAVLSSALINHTHQAAGSSAGGKVITHRKTPVGRQRQEERLTGKLSMDPR